MHRTMIYINDDDYELLVKGAKKKDRSLSELIREALHRYVTQMTQGRLWEQDPIWTMSGIGEALDKNQDARDHDTILYGKRP